MKIHYTTSEGGTILPIEINLSKDEIVQQLTKCIIQEGDKKFSLIDDGQVFIQPHSVFFDYLNINKIWDVELKGFRKL
jgi:hypothetical protein